MKRSLTCLLFALSSMFSFAHAQQDVQVKLDAADLNEAIAAIVDARGFNFGDYTGSIIPDPWFVNLDGGTVDIKNGNALTIHANVVATSVDVWGVINNVTVHTTFDLDGTIRLDPVSGGYKLMFHAQGLRNFTATGVDFIDELIQNHLNSFIGKMPEIELNSGTKLLPDAITSYFTSATPALTTTESEIIFYYTVAGDRKITIQNNVVNNNAVGNMQALEGSNWNTYASPYTAWWTPNSNHSFRIATTAINYSSQWYRFQSWDDNDGATQKNITVQNDHRYTANFLSAQPVTIQTSLEGTNTAVNNSLTFLNSAVSSPYSDYGFMPPNNTSIGTVSSFSLNSTTWKFLNWEDGSTSTSRTVSPTSPTTFTANYHGSLRSNTSTTFANSDQRKVLRTYPYSGGKLLLVYTSLNRVWLEKSEDNGSSWTICNNGQPIDGGPEAKSPAIDFLSASAPIDYSDLQYNEYYITYQQKRADGKYDIKFAVVNDSFVKTAEYTIYSSNNVYTNDAMPVVGAVWYDCYAIGGMVKQFVVVWKEPTNGGFPTGALCYCPFYFSGGTLHWNYPDTRVDRIVQSDNNSTKPTIAVWKDDYAGPQTIPHFHLAWQQSNTAIRYGRLEEGDHDEFGLTAYSQISNGDGVDGEAQVNPSIIAVADDESRIVWLGGNDADTYIILKNPSTGTFYYLDINIHDNVHINRYYDDLDAEAGYVVAWSLYGGSQKRYITSSNLYYPQTLTVTGKDLQVADSYSSYPLFDDLRVVALAASSLPYAFHISSTGLQKGSTGEKTIAGRTAVVNDTLTAKAFNSARVYYTLGNVAVDGQYIDFEELKDTAQITSSAALQRYLTTKPFQLLNSSSLTYDVDYGVVDSALCATTLSNNKSVNFTVELIDTTGKVIGTLNNITYMKNDIAPKASTGYEVDTKSISSKIVQLRLRPVSTAETFYTLIDRHMSASALNKQGNSRQKISLQGNEVVTDYALSQNFPNPFNPSTVINYQLPANSHVLIKVYDVLGREVRTLVDEEKPAGRYSVEFDASKLSSGTYFYTIRAGDYTAVKKMMVMK